MSDLITAIIREIRLQQAIFKGHEATADLLEIVNRENNRKSVVLVDRIAELEDPDWNTYIEITTTWLKKYPPDIFTGESGDPGPLFVVAVRDALAALADKPEEEDKV